MKTASLSSSEVRALYEERQAFHAAEFAQLRRRESALGNGRVGLFLFGVLLAWFAFGLHLLSGWWVLAPLLAFLISSFVHDRLRALLDHAERAKAFYEQGLRRLDGQWAGNGVTGSRFALASHPYAIDLDLFGRGSLFELLCTARTLAGEERLAEWLCRPAARETILLRQAAVVDLTSRIDLRERIALLGENVRGRVEPAALSFWGSEPARLTDRALHSAAFGIAGATLLALIGWWLWFGPLPFFLLAALGKALEASVGARVRHVVKTVEKPAGDLALLSDLLHQLEVEAFEAPLLQELKQTMETEGKAPSARIAQLERLVDGLNARRNVVFAPIASILLWTTLYAFAIEAWRVHNGPYLERWLRGVGEFETLCALASFAYENPDNVFPEIVKNTQPCFEVTGVQHPLLPASQAIRNDVTLNEQTRLLIVSGSNMSGKSTLLRTIGANTILAHAGAPVCARQLRLTPIQLGASIRTQDSLQGGISRFYAEILRLRQIVELSRGSGEQDRLPVLFLLDEILHGTNSHDRLIGAEAVARALLAEGATGLITTHDLALSRMADDTALGAVNVHFEDQIVDGKMTFDYQLRPGVVEKSNAIELMRAVGLPV